MHQLSRALTKLQFLGMGSVACARSLGWLFFERALSLGGEFGVEDNESTGKRGREHKGMRGRMDD